MRLASARLGDRVVHGPVVDGLLHDLSGGWPTMPALLADVVHDTAGVRAAADEAPRHALHELDLLPPVPAPARTICVGVNYADHAAESDRPAEASGHPVLFTRFASSLVGHGQPVERPAASHHFDYEGEMAVVIGRTIRSVDRAGALAAVAGYSCFMDGTLRDFQRHTSQFTPGKNFDRSGAWGPWITTPDDIDAELGHGHDGSGLAITTTVSGEVLQSSTTALLIDDVAAIVAYCSSFTTLEPGDVIATGTPGGVGFARRPQRWLVPGDTVEVTVAGVGTLSNPVVDAER